MKNKIREIAYVYWMMAMFVSVGYIWNLFVGDKGSFHLFLYGINATLLGAALFYIANEIDALKKTLYLPK